MCRFGCWVLCEIFGEMVSIFYKGIYSLILKKICIYIISILNWIRKNDKILFSFLFGGNCEK